MITMANAPGKQRQTVHIVEKQLGAESDGHRHEHPNKQFEHQIHRSKQRQHKCSDGNRDYYKRCRGLVDGKGRRQQRGHRRRGGARVSAGATLQARAAGGNGGTLLQQQPVGDAGDTITDSSNAELTAQVPATGPALAAEAVRPEIPGWYGCAAQYRLHGLCLCLTHCR